MGSSAEHSSSASMEVSPSFSTLSSAAASSLGTPPPLQAKSPPYAAHDRQIDNVIFDLANTDTSIPPQTLHSILRSSYWFEYEKGNLSEEEVYTLAAAAFSLDVSEVGAAFRAARDSIQSDPSMVTLLHELKENNDIQLFAMSNISAPDWEVLRHKGTRERKPNLGYFRHVLGSTGIDPRRTVFVDDKLENVVTARSLGLKGIVFTSFDEVARELRTLVRDPVADGERYLRHHAKQMKSVTNTGVMLEENYAQLLILEATGDLSLVDYIKKAWSSGRVSDHFSPEVKNDIMNEILTVKNEDGIIQTYFDIKRPRIDPIVCVNVLTFFYTNGRGSELRETFDWIYEVLKNRAYTKGTLYYYGPDTFLYFLSRFLSVSIYARRRLGQLFAKRVAEHFGAEGDALALAVRIHAATVVDLCDTRDYEQLGKMQDADGSWPMGWIYKYGAEDVLIGNKGLTTALAVSAMRNYKELELRLTRAQW
ncbi:HAD-like protein [Boletus edulis BED1]|uniref:HAD-like protein n=1 Tax=Boletus edulis BED1 TaxID=1328754 RepID=A0AAD4BK42_BOLED|nr:HAD-like protein [Boletus edulis BED1]